MKSFPRKSATLEKCQWCNNDNDVMINLATHRLSHHVVALLLVLSKNSIISTSKSLLCTLNRLIENSEDELDSLIAKILKIVWLALIIMLLQRCDKNALSLKNL